MLRTIIVTIYTMVASATIIAKISLICESVIVAVVPATPIEPFVINSFTVFSEYNFLGIIPVAKWETLQGMVLLPEVRQSLLAIVGFYFGSSQVK